MNKISRTIVGRWLPSIRTPTFVFEGAERGNMDCLHAMARVSGNRRCTSCRSAARTISACLRQ